MARRVSCATVSFRCRKGRIHHYPSTRSRGMAVARSGASLQIIPSARGGMVHGRNFYGGGPTTTDAITIDPQGRLWATGLGKLWHHEVETWTAHQLPEEFKDTVASMAASSDGTVWLAFHRHGLCGFKEGRFITPRQTADFTQDQVETVSSTSDGQLWVTSANGFYRLSPSRIRSFLIDDPGSPSAANILGGIVETSPGEFIIATQGSGFYRWKNDHASRLSDHPGLGAGGYGNSVVKTSDGTVWLGAKSGLYEMKPDGSIHATRAAGRSQRRSLGTCGRIPTACGWEPVLESFTCYLTTSLKPSTTEAKGRPSRRSPANRTEPSGWAPAATASSGAGPSTGNASTATADF